MSIIQVRNLELTFFDKDQPNRVLRDISFDVDHGEILCLLGLSGAGKTSLLRTLNLLQNPDSGQITINDNNITDLSTKEIRRMRRKIGVVFQQFNLFNNKTVYENIAFPLHLEKHEKSVVKSKVRRIAEELDITDKLSAYPSTLSGGEKQRVAIARAMIVEPELLLLDEPTSALDPKTKDKILDVVNSLNKKHTMTTIVVTHDMDVVKKLSDKVAYLKKGRLKFFGQPQVFFSEFGNEIKLSFDHTDEILEDFQTNLRMIVYFWGEKAKEPLLWKLSQKYSLQLNILSGKIEKLKHGIYGHLVCDIRGESKKAFIEQLRREVFKVELTREVSEID
jgi:D-methionine transport system ATP-binding protein